MGLLRLLGSLKSQVSFAKEPYKRDDILQSRHILVVAMVYCIINYRSLLQQSPIKETIFCRRDISQSLQCINNCCGLQYGVATNSRLLKIIGLFCKRTLQKRRYSANEPYHFKEPTNRSHPILFGATSATAYSYSTRTRTHTYTLSLSHTHTHTHAITHARTRTHTRTHIHIHTHSRAHMHTHTHIHIHTCWLTCGADGSCHTYE